MPGAYPVVTAAGLAGIAAPTRSAGSSSCCSSDDVTAWISPSSPSVGLVAEQVERDLVARQRPLQREERAPVERRQPEPTDRPAMLERRVSLVVLPPVARISRREPRHHPVANHLGDDRRTGDRVDLRVPIDDVRIRSDRHFEPGDPVAVDQDVIVAAKPGNRPAHRQVGRVVDVELVDLADRCGTHADRHGTGADQGRETLALGC